MCIQPTLLAKFLIRHNMRGGLGITFLYGVGFIMGKLLNEFVRNNLKNDPTIAISSVVFKLS